ncbi:serine hydrolase domain-containing protein [Steroidobacter sp.]|uniref:serine hydrolase domain-containing protein n=1 Tax=Steroidobacter sp. TaxID=1978227 RepID=UPI001A5418F5|nr:serine hydrolase domain-containing protein [Steroidobacter sp.]MBL8269641.1 beta-lactamase family protein [Steroidobacter sp.]
MSTFEFVPSTASEAGFSSEPLQDLRLFLHAAVGNGNLPGAVILLARGDKVVLHEAIGYSHIESARVLKTDAIFRLYSMTKPLTAVAMLLLYEEGKWRFDDPVSAYLPEFRDFAKAGSRATREPLLRDLFTHSSGHGFGNTLEEIMAVVVELDLLNAKSLSDLIGKYARVPAMYEPGTRWEYSFAVDLQAAIAEKITGLRFDRFLEQRIFAPLGMHDTGFALSDAQNARLVPGYAMDAATRRLRPGNTLEMQEITFPIGGSSFRSTAVDYARFARMLLGRGSLGDTRILKPESVALMLGNMLPDALLRKSFNTVHYTIGGGNGFGMNGRVCIDPSAAGRPVGKGTYEWAGAHGTWFWADPEHDIVFVGMTHRAMPHTELKPLSLMAEDLVYRALAKA